MFYWGDWTFILLIPAMLVAFWAQIKVQSTFKKYSAVPSSRRNSAADVAAGLLRSAGIGSVQIERIAGQLTDNYDPGSRVLRLSEPVYGSNSIAALGVAAHEVGHAIQHNTGYAALSIRNSIVPVVNFASSASFPLILLGFLLPALRSLAYIGVLLFSAVLVFQLITLPVEINASRRAVGLLSDGGYISTQEVPMVKKVLGAAALTYVAATLVAFVTLLRYLLILGIFSDD